MTMILYSKELEKVLEQCQESSFFKRKITNELFLLICYEYIKTVEDDNEEIKKTRMLFEEKKIDDYKIECLKQLFVENKVCFDRLRYQMLMMELQHYVIKNRSDQIIYLDDVIKAILDKPTNYIRDLLEKKEIVVEKDSLMESEEYQKEDNFLYELTSSSKKLYSELSKKVYGQEHAISSFVQGYFQACFMQKLNLNKDKVKASFLFVGPSGVGKTYLAQQAAPFLGLESKRFDMSEYAAKQSHLQFAGFESTWKDAREGVVTGYVKRNPNAVLIFDEIEKANIDVIHLFLQILDKGSIKDLYHDEEISFKDNIVIFTTNAGKTLYENYMSKNLSGISKKAIIKALEEDTNSYKETYFPKEICSRFASGNVVLFNHMDIFTLEKITNMHLQKGMEQIKNTYGIDMVLDQNITTSLILSEGGNVDARRISAKSKQFIFEELYELFRLLSSESNHCDLNKIKKINFNVEMNDEVANIFHSEEEQEVLIFASDELEKRISGSSKLYKPYFCKDENEAKLYLSSKDIKVVFIEPFVDQNIQNNLLNLEDVNTSSIRFCNYILNEYPRIPIYMIASSNAKVSEEEVVSFIRNGIKDVVNIENKSLLDVIDEVCSRIYKQRNADYLSRFNKVLTFNSGQTLSENQEEATITLMNLSLQYAIEGRDNKQIVSHSEIPNVSFDDVIGAKDVKKELETFIEFLKNPRKYRKLGFRNPKGILLYGPPGTGKTMLAKAVAHEAQMNFISTNGAQFLNKYVGEGANSVRELFKVARKYAPCIIFVDEIDAIAKNRDNDVQKSSDVLNTFLSEMDGFSLEQDANVFIIAATNASLNQQEANSIDEALIRRFDNKFMVDLPNNEERKLFITRKLKEELYRISDLKIENIVKRTVGMSLAYLDSILELSKRIALRNKMDYVDDEILDEALESFKDGKKHIYSHEEILHTARHEAGHAYISAFNGEIPTYLTIVSRKGYGGYMQHANQESKMMYSKKHILNKVQCALAGRASEIMYYGEKEGITTGASNDLAQASKLVENMLCCYGMDEEFGLLVYDKKMIALNTDLHERIKEILEEQLKITIKKVKAGKACIDEIVDKLMSENHMDEQQIKAIYDKYKEEEEND